jgi:MarR family transcriptional regulator, organic hydroperoxide resistance regulator
VGIPRQVEELVSLTAVLAHLERRLSRRLDSVLTSDGLTVDQWRVLEFLSDGEGRPMSSIGAQISVPGATLTKLVDRLVDAALVYRVVGEVDRRRVLVFVAERGREVYERLRPEVAQVEREFLSPVDGEAANTMELLNRLAKPTLPALVNLR